MRRLYLRTWERELLDNPGVVAFYLSIALRNTSR